MVRLTHAAVSSTTPRCRPNPARGAPSGTSYGSPAAGCPAPGQRKAAGSFSYPRLPAQQLRRLAMFAAMHRASSRVKMLIDDQG